MEFKFESESDFMLKLEESFKDELFPIIEKFPFLKLKIFENLKWGAFFNQTLTKDGDFWFPKEFSQNLLNEVKKNSNISIFDENIEKFLTNNTFKVYFKSFEDFDVKAEIEDKNKFDYVNQVIKLKLTVPDYEVVFSDLLTDDVYSDSNDWLMEDIAIYEEWSSKFYNRQNLYQIGGNGSWIQESYNGYFIGQINGDYGDCGSIFMFLEKDKVSALVDMS